LAEVKEVSVPDIGDFDEVPVIEVLVSAGDAVAEEDPLVTLESDKATMDVPAPFAGTVQELKVNVGDKVSQGTALLMIEVGGGDNGAAPAQEPKESKEPGKAGAAETAVEAEAEAGTGSAPEPSAAPSEGDAPVYASPAVRRLAREKGIDLASVEGSGRKGRITKDDVERGPSEAPFSPAPVSIESSSVPCATLSPTETWTSCTTPANGAGTSIVALSDSSVTSGSSSATVSPGETSTSITGTSSKSPMSGTVTSFTSAKAPPYRS